MRNKSNRNLEKTKKMNGEIVLRQFIKLFGN
jgi:hypothetical protein